MNDEPSKQPGLVRALGPLMATAVVIGTVIGSGVFKKPSQVAAHVDYFGLTALVWILVGGLAFLGALALAEVAVLYPRAGGNYVFLREAYGRMAGFLWGWVEFWIIRGASLGALAYIFAQSFNDLLGLTLDHKLGFWQVQGLTVATILGLALVNIRGVRWGGLLQLFITTVKVASLLGIMVLPFIVLAVTSPGDDSARPPSSKKEDGGDKAVTSPGDDSARPSVERLKPTWPEDWSTVAVGGLFSACLAVLWAYHGWMNIAPVAEEVRRPQRNIPLALLAGVGTIIFLYLGANLAYSLTLSRTEMAGLKNTTTATAFSLRLLGPIGAALASAAVMCSVFGALNGNLLVGPRLLFAMGRDKLAPPALAAVNLRWHTPALAILVMALWASVLVMAAAVATQVALPVVSLGKMEVDLNVPPDKDLFDILTDFAMFGAVIFETMAVMSIFVFRWRRPDAERAYRCPGYPVVPALYVILPAMILGNMFVHQRMEALVGVAFISLGALVYWLVYAGQPQQEDKNYDPAADVERQKKSLPGT